MQRPFRLEPCQEQRRQYPAGSGLEKAYGRRGACARMVQLPPRRVQTDFFRPKLLGSSIIEGENVGMNLKQASCISCHTVSSVESNGTDGINLLAALNP